MERGIPFALFQIIHQIKPNMNNSKFYSSSTFKTIGKAILKFRVAMSPKINVINLNGSMI